jgi:hypothetical protein
MRIISDNKTHEAACVTAESARQTAVAAAIAAGGGTVQSAVKTAEIAFYRSVVASCLANGLPFGNFTQALRDLGTGGS